MNSHRYYIRATSNTSWIEVGDLGVLHTVYFKDTRVVTINTRWGLVQLKKSNQLAYYTNNLNELKKFLLLNYDVNFLQDLFKRLEGVDDLLY